MISRTVCKRLWLIITKAALAPVVATKSEKEKNALRAAGEQ